MISDLELYGVPTAHIKTASIHLSKYPKYNVILEIEKLFSDNDYYAIDDATSAILTVVTNSSDTFTLEEQRCLIQFVLYAIIWGSYESTVNALYIISNIVEKHPILLNKNLHKMVLLALRVTAKNTDPKHEFSTMIFEKSLSVRCVAASLAYQTYLLYFEKNEEIPQEISMWERICESDTEFAEVRNQWKANLNNI